MIQFSSRNARNSIVTTSVFMRSFARMTTATYSTDGGSSMRRGPARRVFPVVTVQNRYNLVDRDSEAVLAYCAANTIGFIPWFPLAAGKLTRPGGMVDRIAKAHGATAGQVALAWLLQHSPVILPIPGTLRVAHLEENVAAAALSLRPEEIGALDAA